MSAQADSARLGGRPLGGPPPGRDRHASNAGVRVPAVQILVPTVTGTVTVTVTVELAKTQLPVTQAGSELELEE